MIGRHRHPEAQPVPGTLIVHPNAALRYFKMPGPCVRLVELARRSKAQAIPLRIAEAHYRVGPIAASTSTIRGEHRGFT
jgi:hypothetical protein